jgi:sugar/nucleoside kinase (ribokinase family)
LTGSDPRLVVLGQLSIDDVVMPDGETTMGACGGDATYAALGAALWTRPVGMVAPRGIGFPTEHVDAIVGRGVDRRGISDVPGPAIRYWVLYEADGRRTYVQRSPGSAFADMAPLVDQIPEAYWSSSCFHLAAMPFASVERLVAAIRTRLSAAMITLDTHEDEIAGFQERIGAILPSITAFLPSREEVATWFGWDDPERAIGELGALGQQCTVIKMGGDGCLVHDARTGRRWHVAIAPGPVVDVTGAGDAFCGGFAAGLVLGDSPPDAARRGAASASLSIGGFCALHDWMRPDEAARRLALTGVVGDPG